MTTSLLIRGLSTLCAMILTVLIVVVLWGVLSRQILGGQPAWTEELARVLLVWLALLGGVLAYADERHLGVDVLVDRLHPDARRIVSIASHLCVLAFSLAVFAYGGTALFHLRWDSGQTLPATGVRKAWFYLVLPIVGVLLSHLALCRALAGFRSWDESGRGR